MASKHHTATFTALYVCVLAGSLPASAATVVIPTYSGGVTLRLVAGNDYVIDAGSSYIESIANNSAILDYNGVVANSLTNDGVLAVTAGAGSSYFMVNAQLGSLTNNGTMYSLNGHGIGMANASATTIGSVLNTGLIQGAMDGIISAGIGTITNTGAIVGATDIIDQSGRTVGTLNNLQGAATTYVPYTGTSAVASGALTYKGNLPQYYNVIVDSTSQYGQLANAGGVSGTMAFNIYGNTGTTLVGGVAASSVANNTLYSDVLQGFSGTLSAGTITGSGFSITGATGSYGGYTYSLVADAANPGDWSLLFGSLSTDVVAGCSACTTANLGGSVNPRLDGGTLSVSSAGTVGTALSMTNNGGTLDESGLASTFSGVISNDGASTQGKLTIVNSGTAGQGFIALTGANTYTGGTEVDAGATLSIDSAAALGSGGLALVGNATTPAVLDVTGTTTIANPISVAGDPVFNIATGTTTTVSSPITDAGTPGDLVLNNDGTSTGTLQLTAVNTYTGVTTIDAGTLMLAGAGSIAASSAVTNNGTLDVSTAGATVAVTNYTQGSGGTLTMALAPTGARQLAVSGTASLAGTLNLVASAGSFRPGRYTLITSSGALTGSFSTLGTNLSAYTPLAYSLAYAGNAVDLVLAPQLSDTNASTAALAAALQAPVALETLALRTDLSGNDCSTFDRRGVCVGAAGRYTMLGNDGPHDSAAIVYGGYRVDPHLRVGGWADQNLAARSGSALVGYGDTQPMVGAWGVWTPGTGEQGLAVRLAVGYGEQGLNLSRPAVGSAEPGAGATTLSVEGARLEIADAIAVRAGTLLTPYAALRYTKTAVGAYAEQAGSQVSAPLSVGALVDEVSTLEAGLRVAAQLGARVTGNASLGVEQDLSGGTATATVSSANIGALAPLSLNTEAHRTRAVATLGASYAMGPFQQLGVSLVYAQQPYGSRAVTVGQLRYTAGF